MNFLKTNQYLQENKQFLLDHMMGPNAFRVTEELTRYLTPKPAMRVLDLGCGMGLSSILLAETYDAMIFAADLWVSPTENYQRFSDKGLAQQIIPLSVDVTKGLPFAEEFFDAIVCVDAYHYFGANEDMLPFLSRFLKPEGQIAVAVPGVQQELTDGLPAHLREFLPEDHNFHSLAWWKALWSTTDSIQLGVCREMDSHRLAWDEWLESENPHAVGDRAMMAAENDEYFNHIQLLGRKR